jgi:hypothetical protein
VAPWIALVEILRIITADTKSGYPVTGSTFEPGIYRMQLCSVMSTSFPSVSGSDVTRRSRASVNTVSLFILSCNSISDRLMVFENRVLRRISGFTRYEVTGEWGTVHKG